MSVGEIDYHLQVKHDDKVDLSTKKEKKRSSREIFTFHNVLCQPKIVLRSKITLTPLKKKKNLYSSLLFSPFIATILPSFHASKAKKKPPTWRSSKGIVHPWGARGCNQRNKSWKARSTVAPRVGRGWSINSARASSSSSSPVERLYEPTAAANEDAALILFISSHTQGCVLWPEPRALTCPYA